MTACTEVLKWIFLLHHSFLIKFNCRKLITNEFWSPLSSDLQGKPGVACLTQGSRAWEWDLIYRQPTAKNSLSSPRTNGVLFGWHLPHGNLQCLPSDCVSSNGDAQKTGPSFQPRWTPDGPLLFFQRAPDFYPVATARSAHLDSPI